jgi:hypothetical protein
LQAYDKKCLTKIVTVTKIVDAPCTSALKKQVLSFLRGLAQGVHYVDMPQSSGSEEGKMITEYTPEQISQMSQLELSLLTSLVDLSGCETAFDFEVFDSNETMARAELKLRGVQ